MSKKKNILFVIIIVLSVATIAMLNYYENTRPRQVSIEVNYNKIELFISKASVVDEHGHAIEAEENIIYKFTGSSQVELPPATYVIHSQQSDTIKPIFISFSAEPKNNFVAVNVEFTSSALSEIKNSESSIIMDSIKNAFPLYTTKRNSIKEIDVHGQGEWASAIITTNTFYEDYFHVVLHKDDKKWTVVTEPKIILSSEEYPSIPKNILEEVNRLQFKQEPARL